MIVAVKQTDFLKGTVQLPSSKSYTIRAFIIAAQGGNSVVHLPSDCDDALVAKDVAKQLGSQIKKFPSGSIQLKAKAHSSRYRKINVRESGTVLRFLLPLLAFKNNNVTIIGQGTLKGRPNRHLIAVLKKQGIHVKGKGAEGSVPILIEGGVPRGGKVIIDGSLSSQFISALLIACPALANDTLIQIKGKKLVSNTYIIMTLQVLKRAGIKIVKKSGRLYAIKGHQRFKGLKSFTVPADYGLAAFLMGAAILSKSDMTLNGFLHDDLVQSDREIIPFLSKSGARFLKTQKSIRIKGPFFLKGGKFSLKNSPDLVPVMSILALFAKQKTRLCDIAHVRAKESDRISDLRKELLKIGAVIKEKKNELTIYPQNNYKKNVLLNPHRDHRLAMAFCLLGIKLGVRVKDIECTAKSYPRFLKDFKQIGARISRIRSA